jgi:hypothetical protein
MVGNKVVMIERGVERIVLCKGEEIRSRVVGGV